MGDAQHRVTIDRVWPDPQRDLDDDALIAPLLEPCVRVNFVSSVDGAVTRDGLSGGLSTDADKRYFELLRRAADVVLVGAGTVRAEGYGPLRVSDESAAWRVSRGWGAHPVFAIVTRTLDIDRAIIEDAPTRPIVFTVAGQEAPSWLADGADVVVSAGDSVDGREIVGELKRRDLVRVLCEGGPHLFGSVLEADVVDELCLTVSPTLEGASGPRMTEGLRSSRDLELVSLHASGSTLLTRWARRG